VLELASNNVIVTGQVKDLFEYYNKCKVFIVPTRYAGGIAFKLHEASSYGIPAVVTPLIADQVNWEDGKNLLIGNNARDFADKCIELYTDKNLWEKIRAGSLEMVKKDCNRETFIENLYKAIELVK